MRPPVDYVSMKPVTLFLAIAALYIGGSIAHAAILQKTIYGDGIYYYSWLRSAVVDRDMSFANEFARFGITGTGGVPGLIGNKYSIGPAILWLPSFVALRAVFGGDGYGFPYQLGIGLTGVLYALTGLVLLYRLMSERWSQPIALAVVAATAGATNLLFYGSVDTVNSHALSFFAACVFLSFLLRRSPNWWAVGAALGLLALIRPQDALYGLLIVPFMPRKNVWKAVAGALLAFTPQLFVWHALYGTFFTSPYFLSGEGFAFTSPHVFGVLFTPANGLFLWTPVLLFALVGYFSSHAKKNPFLLYGFGVITLEIILVASWSTWWQGASYGGRMFVSVLPLFAFGLADAFLRATKRMKHAGVFLARFVAFFSALNVVSVFFYLQFVQ